MLRLLYHGTAAVWGPTQGKVFGVGDYRWVLLWYVALIVPLYLPSARSKASHRDLRWLKYL